jgi:hypothetical protein
MFNLATDVCKRLQLIRVRRRWRVIVMNPDTVYATTWYAESTGVVALNAP